MKVKCIKTSFIEDDEVAERLATNLEAKLHITRDKTYIVYALKCSNRLIEYLIQDDNYLSSFYPANLFDVVDTQMPYEEWHLGKFQNPVAINDIVSYFYVLGSKEMATNYDLFMSIVEHDREGLFHFEEWRKLIDRQYE